jgi:hypothetical protein
MVASAHPRRRLHLYVPADQLVLRLYVWPLQEFRHYRDSTQRVYLSATLGSADDLQRRLGCRPVALIDVDAEHGEPLGRRVAVTAELPDRRQADALDARSDSTRDRRRRHPQYVVQRPACLDRPAAPEAVGETADEAGDRMLTTFDLRASQDGGKRSRFERLRTRTGAKLASRSHAEFQEGLEETGRLLGSDAVRPRGTGATDARWGWSEGGRRQLLVWKAKIEHAVHGALAVSDVDQANGQLTAARAEFAPRGVVCRGALVRHLEPDTTAAGRLGDVTLDPRRGPRAMGARCRAVRALPGTLASR